MKKITLLFVGVLISTASIFGQSIELQQWIDSQYKDASHQAFIYAVSRQAKAADLQVLRGDSELRKRFEDVNRKLKGKIQVNSDTTWNFTEYKAPNDSIYKMTNYNYRWTEGETYEDSRTYYNFYIKQPDSTKWWPEKKQTSIRSSTSSEDSTIWLYYQSYEPTPYYGNNYRTVKTPANNADYEYYRDQYSADLGWYKYEHGISFRNENGYDTLRFTEKYKQETMEYVPASEERYIFNDDYNLNSRKYFNSDSLSSIANWNYSFTKYDNDRTLYQVSKNWNYVKKVLEGTDSLYFDYHSEYVEGRGFVWQDSAWNINTFYRSYQRTFPNPDPNDTYHPTITEVDSVIVYSVYPDSVDEKGNIVIDDITMKTQFYYDANGNQIEVQNYQLNTEGELALTGKTIKAYKLVKDFYSEKDRYVLVLQETYGTDYLTKMLYKSGESTWFYNDEGLNIGTLNVNLNTENDTTYASGSHTLLLEDGTRVYTTLGWDYQMKKMIVQGYRAFPASTQEEGYLNQTTYIDARTNSGNRSITVGGKIPAVMNDGPLNVSMGDTLLLYISARNIDFTIPEVSVTNMPATATFNPETRRFYWVVDEEAPSPMTYTATNSRGTSSVEVQFVNVDLDDIFVGNEKIEELNKFSLAQNYPNPFNPSTTITFNLPQASEVSLKVFNMLGQEVATLVNDRMGQGVQAIQFDASHLASGMYIYRLQASGFVETRKMMLIK